MQHPDTKILSLQTHQIPKQTNNNTLREPLRTHKVFTKTSVFSLIIISSPLNHMFWMSTTSTTYDFMEKYRKFSVSIILILTPDFPHFYYMLGGNLGSLLYGDVSVMNNTFSLIGTTGASPSWHFAIHPPHALSVRQGIHWLSTLSTFGSSSQCFL